MGLIPSKLVLVLDLQSLVEAQIDLIPSKPVLVLELLSLVEAQSKMVLASIHFGLKEKEQRSFKTSL